MAQFYVLQHIPEITLFIELHLIMLRIRHRGYKDEIFIMASQARLVFYMEDPSVSHQFIVVHGKQQLVQESEGGSLRGKESRDVVSGLTSAGG
ncbi:hypothetical protein QQ045_023469 [Rhodiola kirilowii]